MLARGAVTCRACPKKGHIRMSSSTVRRRRAGVAALATVALACGGVLSAAPAVAADPVTINLVTFNDFHGRIENDPNSAAAGIAALAGAIDEVRAANPNTVVAAAGDLVGASTFASFIQNDEPTIAALTAAGLDVSAAGNHEFDQGWADLRDRIQPAAGWQYIAANLHDRATGEPIMPEYYTETFDGVTIGFIGAVTDELPSLVSPAGIADVVVGDVADNVNRVADDLRDGDPANGEADVVVLLVHEGAGNTTIEAATDPSTPFGRIVTQVDADVNAIVSGHTHLAYNHVINDRPVISSGQYGEKFSNMEIIVDPETKQLVSMVNQTFALKTGQTLNYPENQAIKDEIVAPASAYAFERGKVSLGSITADFNRAKQANGTSENRGGESTLGNWVADVHLWAAQQQVPDTQIAFMNPGGLRADLKFASSADYDGDGNVTYKEAADVQPFANGLVTLSLTGEQIRTALEQQWQPAGASRPFLKLGVSEGFQYTFDPTAPVGQRITSMTLNGEALDPSASYGVVANAFLAGGGDNFGAFAQGTNRAESGVSDLQSVVNWFVAHPTAEPNLAQRAVGVQISAPAAPEGYVAGESVTFTLSGLEFSSTEPVAGTVTASLGSASVTADITRTVTATDDLTGEAVVSLAIPADVSGAVTVSITTPTGTAVSVPLTVQAPVVKVDTTTVVFANKIVAKKNQKVKVTALVWADGEKVDGSVTLYDSGVAVATATVDKHGVAKFTLSNLSIGMHKLTAVYEGNDTLNGSTSSAWPVLVWR